MLTLFYLTVLGTMAAVLIAVILLAIGFKHQQLYLKWLTVLLCFSFLSDLSSAVASSLGVGYVNQMAYPYSILSTPVFCLVFYYMIGSTRLKLPLVMLCGLYTSILIIDLAWLHPGQMPSYSNTMQSLIIIVLAVIYFWVLMRQMPTAHIQQLASFWIASAFFFSYSGKLIIYSVRSYLIEYLGDSMIILWSFHNLLSIIANIMLCYAAWLSLKPVLKRIQPAKSL